MRRKQYTDANLNNDRVQGANVIRRVVPYLWPKDQPDMRRRVVISLTVLFLAKLIAVWTPQFYRQAVDALAPDGASGATMLGLGAVGLTIAYGIARLMDVGFQQLRDVVFAPVGQRALRRLAAETFEHIHRLSLRYHITRKTGGLSRIIERGVKGVSFLLRFLLFSIGPLLLQLIMIAIILSIQLDFAYMVVVLLTITSYIAFTFRITEWRVKIRKEMNEQDTDANQKAIDSLLNFETVKYFGAEKWESDRYDVSMQGYERAAIKTSNSLAILNFGQSLLITTGLVVVMVMAAIGVENGTLTVGEFVMVNAYMIQITMPMNFLGTVYREIRQALIDMGDMFDLLDQPPEITDKPAAADISVQRGQIDFEGVHFGYDSDRDILKDVSFSVPGGQTIAIVGSSGSGKSTIGR
jgi:ATP-binding cassette subfamily B protein